MTPIATSFMSAEEAKDYGLIDEIIQGRIKSGGAPNGESSNGGRPPGGHPRQRPPQAGARNSARVNP